MAENSIAQAYVQVIPSAQGIKGKLTEAMGGEADAAGRMAGDSIVSKIKGAILAAGIGTAIVGTVKKALSEGMELQQNLGGTEAVFGDFAQNIQDTAKTAYTNMGLSASDYMATANKMGSLFQGSGVEQQKALEMTTQAMQRAADVASVMGVDMNMAMESVAGAAKGNFTMMDNLGVAMNATTLEAYALEKGINFKWNTADNAQKAELAMQMFMERTSQYAGNFKKESEDTVSGSIGAVKAAFQNMLGAMATGEAMQGPIEEFTATAVAAAENIFPMLKEILNRGTVALFGVVTDLLPQLIAEIPNAIGDLNEIAMTLIEQLETSLPGLAESIVTTLPQIISEAMSSLSDISNAASGVIDWLVSGLSEGIPQLIDIALSLITQFTEFLATDGGQLIDSGMNLIMELAEGLVAGLPHIIEALPQIITNILTYFTENFPKMIELGLNLIVTLAAGLIQAIPSLVAAIPQITMAIWNALITFDWLGLGQKIIKTIVDGFLYLHSMVSQTMKSIGEKALYAMQNIDWYGLGQKVIRFVINGIKLLFNDIPNKLREIGQNAVTSMLNIRWGQLGSDIINGIINGVKAMAGAFRDAIVNMAKGALDEVKAFLGIASPSRIFRDEVGKMIPAGIAVGISANTDMVTDAMDEISRNALTVGMEDFNSLIYTPKDITVSTSNDGKIDTLIDLLRLYLPECAQPTVIDGDSLMQGINRQLGLEMV